MSKPIKRSAASELNSDNWDQEDEPEEAGTFKPIGQEELSKRAIKVARRRLPKQSDENRPLFSNFGGFGSKQTNTTPDLKSSFSFLSNLNGSNSQSGQASANEKSDSSSSQLKNGSDTKTTAKELEYLENLKSLNKCLLDWLDRCVKKNPSCILTPIFKDYEKHLELLKKQATEKETPKPTSTPPGTPKPVPTFNFVSNVCDVKTSSVESSSAPTGTPKPVPTFNFGSNVKDVKTSSIESSSTPPGTPKPVPTFKFGSNVSDVKTSSVESSSTSAETPRPVPTFKFGSNASDVKTSSVENSSTPTKPVSNPFSSLSTSTPSSWLSSSALSKSNVFSNLAATNTKPSSMFGNFSNSPSVQPSSEKNEASKEEGDGEDEAPVNDFKPVTEENALYSHRVKLFVQKDKQYTDRGVGTLYVKEAKDAKDNKIYQALIRADTNLGNIIFNVRLTSDIPKKRVGKNNVMMVCIPNPDTKPPPVPVLLRVKTSEEADKLLEELEKYK